MQVDDALLSRLEKLSFLKISEDKREEIIRELSEIVGFVDNLGELDTKSIDATFAMSDTATPLREDTPNCNPKIHQEILKHALKSADDFFVVPKIIE